jgi:N-acetylmuramoyl-L-alanine amidase
MQQRKKTRTVIWDSGHGGVINGIYQTEGKRSPNWDKGVLYEGAANRWFVNDTMKLMDFERLPYTHVSPELFDIGLQTRCDRANTIYRQDRDAYVVSVHCNAAGGTGWEIFTSPGETFSDYIAHEFIEAFKDVYPLRPRLGGTRFLTQDKEANYKILRDTNCPAILIEVGFMDRKEDYYKLWDPQFHAVLAKTLLNGVKRVNLKYGK